MTQRDREAKPKKEGEKGWVRIMSLQIIKLLVRSCRKESSKFENYALLQSFLLVLSVGAKRRPRIIMSSIEWLG